MVRGTSLKDGTMSARTNRNRLERRRDDLRRLLANYQRGLRAASSADLVDMAQEKEGDEVLEELEVSALREIEQIDAALGRIGRGNYDICQLCGGPIGRRRLDALPYATHCIECASVTDGGEAR